MAVNGRHALKRDIIWELSSGSPARQRKKESAFEGTLVLDIDGTLTVPGRKYEIHCGILDVLISFLAGGGRVIFNTGAILGRIERGTLVPLYSRIDEEMGAQEADKLFRQICVMPENGSAVLLNKDVAVVENELKFSWYRVHELHLPDKAKLRGIIARDLIPLQPGSSIAGDKPHDATPRDYILSWKNVSSPTDLVKHIKFEVTPRYPEVAWQKIALKAARTTIDFVNADSGKSSSIVWVLGELSGFGGPIIGFGDLGDEFAEIVPTINVNREKPNEFRRRHMPSMELSGTWDLLKKRTYVVTGSGKMAKVQCTTTGIEIKVLRNDSGEILYARKASNGYLIPTSRKRGKPVRISPLTYQNGQGSNEVPGAGPGTTWMLRRLIDAGYFNKRH